MKINKPMAAALLVVVFAGCRLRGTDEFRVAESAERNPWTHLQANADPDNFQFIIVADRTGGHRPGIFGLAVDKINLLQPEFVLCVGDLIEGYTDDETVIDQQWREFNDVIARLQMPFFYLPGNHDQTNPVMVQAWKERYGRSFYHFLYKDVLFLCLNSESTVDDPGALGALSAEQIDYFRQVLDKHPGVRWTLVLMHKPLWRMDDPTWAEFAELLHDRPATIFAGHEHRYLKSQRDGQNHFVLSTTGGFSELRGPSCGEFDHLVWVTQTDSGPILANLMLEGIWDENIVTEEMGNLIDKQPFIIEPLFVDADRFRGRHRLRLQLINDGAAPLDVKGRFRPNPHILPSPQHLQTTLAPESRQTLEIDLTSLESLPLEAVRPLEIDWKLKSALPNNPNFAREVDNSAKPVRRYACRKRSTPVRVDGVLDEWETLPLVVDPPGFMQFDPTCYTGSQDARFAFAVETDEENLYIAVRVKDDIRVYTPSTAPWQQDGIEIRLDARPASLRDHGKNIAEIKEILFVGLSPAAEEREMVFYKKESMPVGLEAICVETADGHVTEVRIPHAYLDARQGEPWNAFRLNIAVNDFDTPDERGVQLWWQPDWRRSISPSGSGTFVRN
ncbi:metallophosphoesterase [candidate division KSB1 bacterium]|nr:metallophosphoesterase [candidate division KSB1 bacterium]